MVTESEIGKNINKLRTSLNLTLDELAKRSGFSKGYLSKVENSDKAPPVSTLINIAEALDVGISDLFGDKGEKGSICLVKKGERRLMARGGTAFGYSYQTLAHKFVHKHMEPYILTVPRNPKRSPWFQHKGEEMLLVLKGCMRFIHGGKEYLVEEGDCVYFDSSIPHHGFAVGEQEEVQCVMVIYTP